MAAPRGAAAPIVDRRAVLDDLRRLVEAESPSSDPAALARSARAVAAVMDHRLGGGAVVTADADVVWDGGAGNGRPVLVLGHHDTVWPLGTLRRLPFGVTDGRVSGPGVFDMKGGLVVAVHALAALQLAGELPPVRLLVTSDEEIGSVRSRTTIEAEARRCRRVLVPEPCGPGEAVKTARKGVALGHVVAHGRASHSGLAPRQGINAVVALGALLPAIEAMSDDDRGTTVTPTLLRGGSTVNTVPASARVDVDIRFLDDAEVDRVGRELAALTAANGARIEVAVEVNRPALTEAASAPLLPALQAAAATVGQSIGAVAVGGASDGNLAAAAGAAVLDGLGPEGDGAHADHEHVTVTGLERRIALLAALLPRVAVA